MDDPIRPQRATPALAEVISVNWLFEPAWPGDRLLALRRGGRVSLTDSFGAPASDGYEELANVLADAILADDTLVDGVWSAQPFVGDGSPARAWADTLAREGLDDELPDPLASERRRAFVAIDLMELEGEPLYEVPFQERRRLLESVIDQGIRVRISPIVKQPIGGWLIGWRANGFTHYLAKHVNSRYRPGTTADDWLEIPVNAARAPRGLLGRVLGGRAERVRRVRD